MNKDTQQTPEEKLKKYLDSLYAKSQPFIRAEVELAIKSDAAKEYHQSQQKEVDLWSILDDWHNNADNSGVDPNDMTKLFNALKTHHQPAVPESDKTIQNLVVAIETTITGIEWNSENKPECFRKADAEHLQYLRDTLTKYKQSKTSSDAV